MAEYVLNNRYRVLAQIAGGGMAVVYKAHDTVLNRVVAVKVLRDTFAQDVDFRARFQHEAQAAANLTHPNIVTVYDYGQDGLQSYIVMEYIEGRDLKTVIRGEAPLPLDRATDLMVQACAALGAAHRAGLVHCDVKPQNILVTNNDSRVKVTDFGIARAMSASVPQNVETVWGTPHYFSPEQAAGEPPTPASDVYSLGVVLYEMLAGRVPFDAPDHTALALQHMRDEPPPLTALNPAVPIQIEQIVNKALAKDPANRYRTADQLGRALLDYRRATNQATGYQRAVPVLVPTGSTTVAATPVRSPGAAPAMISGTDWLGWMLGTLAFVAVVGLIPLFVLVWRAYSQPASVPTVPAANPTVTPANGATNTPTFGSEVLVPNLIGRTQQEAELLATKNGLTVSIGAGRFDPKVPTGSVVAQNPIVGKKVAKGATIEIALSQGPKVSAATNLLNTIYEADVPALEPYGWDIRLIEEYNSQEPYHKVLEQDPAPGFQLAAGQPFTLTVSGGTTVTLGVNIDNQIWLDAVNLPRDQVKRGEQLDATLLWRGQRRITTPYTVFVHFVGPDGKIVTQVDSEPPQPTTSWPVSATISDPYALDIPPTAAPGVYQLLVGLYPTGQPNDRLPISDVGKTSADNNNRILIKEITVQP